MSDQREYGPAAYVNAPGVEIGYYPTIRADEVRTGDQIILGREEGRVTSAFTERGRTDLFCTSATGMVFADRQSGDMLPLVSGEPARTV